MTHEIVNFEKNITPRTQGDWDSIRQEYPDTSLKTYLIPTDLIGDSVSTEFIPFINAFTGKVFKREDNGKRILIYNFDSSAVNSPTSRRGFATPKPSYDNLLYSLAKDLIPQWFISDKVELQAAKGILFEYDKFTGDYKILMILAVKKDYFWEMKNKTSLDYSKFALFINNEFTTEDRFSTVFKKLEKEYIIDAINKGIDVIYTNHIIKKCYQYTFTKPKFKTVSDMLNHLDKLNDIVHNEIKL